MGSQKQERGVKRVTKIIVLASIFSFILSYSSLISSLQQILHLLSMYSNLVDKKYMFLLCNCIVGFVLGNFETLLHGNAINIIEESKEVDIIGMREAELKKAVALLGEKSASKQDEVKGGEEVKLIVEGILEEEDLAIIRIDDHDGDDSEDLNKKCEEFIRKVKAEIRLDPQKLITFIDT